MNDNFLMDEKFFEADQLIKDGKYAQALELLTEVITEMPEHGRSHNHIGWIYETKYSDYAKAEKHYKAALAFSPEYPAIYYNYAILLSTTAKFEELNTLLQKAMDVTGINKATIHNEFAIMYEAQQKYNKAIDSFNQNILHLYDNKLIETARASIDRCKSKMMITGEELNVSNNNNNQSFTGNRRRD